MDTVDVSYAGKDVLGCGQLPGNFLSRPPKGYELKRLYRLPPGCRVSGSVQPVKEMRGQGKVDFRMQIAEVQGGRQAALPFCTLQSSFCPPRRGSLGRIFVSASCSTTELNAPFESGIHHARIITGGNRRWSNYKVTLLARFLPTDQSVEG